MKRAEKQETKGTVVREVVTPEAVGRITETGDRRTEVGIPYEPGVISQAWGMAVKGLAYQVAFGAMLCELDTSLTRETSRRTDPRGGGEDTLKGWLSENCPTVNYKTAMRWKSMAKGVMGKALPDGTGVIRAGEVPVLLGILPPAGVSFGSEEDRKREALERFLSGKSQSDVFSALRGPGRPKGTPGGGRRALTAAEKTEDAKKEVKELLGALAAFCAGPKLLMLPQETRESTATALKDLAARFKEGRPFGG